MQSYIGSVSGEEIYQSLKNDILTLKLKPGQRISENEISSSYRVSRTPVKTAFLRLKGEKYIEIVPQKGSFVTLLDMQYIRDIIYMRHVLEMDMLKTVMRQGKQGPLLARLGENLARQREMTKSPALQPKDFYEIDSRFHYMLFEHAGRGKMWDIIQDCQVYYTRFRILDTLTTARYRQLYEEHTAIAGHLAAGDPAALERQVHDHLHGNLRVLAERIPGELREYFIPEGNPIA